MARKSRSVMAWVEAEMATHPPSFVAYTLRGDCDSVALPVRRRTRRVSLWMAASGPRIEKIESSRLEVDHLAAAAVLLGVRAPR